MSRRLQTLLVLPWIAVIATGTASHAQAQTATALAEAARYADSARAHVTRAITPPIDAPPPAAPPASMLFYLGEYGSQLHSITVLEHEGSLHALFGGVELKPMLLLSGDTFLLPDSTAMRFTRTGARVDAVMIDGSRHVRRALGPEDGATFRITPLRPVPELYREAIAAAPPIEPGEFRTSDLVELRALDATIRYDIRYATRNNFMGEVFYSQPRAFLQRPAAEAVARAAQRLKRMGYGLLIHDAYRPWYVTKMFWDATPDSLRDFVADPAGGSRHNRGAAVDLSLYDLDTGEAVVTVSGYDEFSPRAFPDYPGGTSRQRWFRAALRAAMEAEGFTVYRNEWWHFDYGDWRSYPIGNRRFEELEGS